MRNFFINLIRSDKPESSKRMISLCSFLLFVIVVIASLNNIIIQDSIIYAIVSLILGSSIMTLTQSNSKSETKDGSKETP